MKKQLEGQLKNANITVVNSSADIQLDTNMMTGQTAPVIAIWRMIMMMQEVIFQKESLTWLKKPAE